MVKWLVSHGQEALHVLDVGLAESQDNEIWKYVEDFSWRASTPDAEVSVVWVRLGNCRRSALLSAFDSCWSRSWPPSKRVRGSLKFAKSRI